MSDIRIFNLIDSLNEIPRCPFESLPELVIRSLQGFFEPAAIIVQVQTPRQALIEKSSGEQPHAKILDQYLRKFLALEVGSAEFIADEAENNIIACAQIRNLQGHKGVISAMISRTNPYKYLIRQILELYIGNIVLGFTLQKFRSQLDIRNISGKILAVMSHLGVNGLLLIDKDVPDVSIWFDNSGSKELALPEKIKKSVSNDKIELTDPLKEKLISALPDSVVNKKIAFIDFSLAGKKYRNFFLGDFKRDEVVLSKFQNLIMDYDQPAGYDEVIRAFQRLKDDHRMIVKGERVAAILETAVAINHEINNPLTAVLGNTQLLLLQKDKLPKDVIAKINTIEKSALRIRQVTQKLMTIVEPITTSYTENLDMLDIDKSSSPEAEEEAD